jgi:hypothetical protein
VFRVLAKRFARARRQCHLLHRLISPRPDGYFSSMRHSCFTYAELP